jgi:hypothetical protein
MMSRTNRWTKALSPDPAFRLTVPLLLLASLAGASAQNKHHPAVQAGDPPPKDAHAIIASACANEYASDRSDHTAFIYRDHDITPDHDTTYAIVETPEGNLKRKVEDHGRPLTSEDRAADDARISALMKDKAKQQKLKKDSAHDDEQADELLNLLPTAFLWTIAGENGDLITMNFKPDPNFDPPNIEARVFADMAGEVVVSRSENRIRSMKGQMVDDVKILGGVIGKLHKGGTFQVEHREVAPHHWQLTELHVHIVGHILFNFKTIGSQEDEVKTDFKISPAQNFQQAYDILYAPAGKAAAK